MSKEFNFEKDIRKCIVLGQSKKDAMEEVIASFGFEEGSQLNIKDQDEPEFIIKIRAFGVETAQRDGSGGAILRHYVLEKEVRGFCLSPVEDAGENLKPGDSSWGTIKTLLYSEDSGECCEDEKG